MTGRVLFHVQHLLGVGHLKRAATIVTAMAEAGLQVTVALGGRPLPEVAFRCASVAQLPPATIAGEDFSTLLDDTGRPVDAAWKEARCAALLSLYRELDPDVLLVELFPFGRRPFRFELIPLLEAVHASSPRPRVACSVRDILVGARKPGREAETVATLRASFDAILVHGDPKLIPFKATFAAAGEIADLIRYTGYVAESAGPAPPAGIGEVLVSAGGGAVGAPLLFAALRAKPLSPLPDRTWRIIAGPNFPAELQAALAAEAGPGIVVERFRPEFPALLAGCAVSISQAGYNTTMDILRAGARAVVVPYETPGETEQRRRADLLAGSGFLTVVPADELSPERLAAAVAEALSKPRGPTAEVDLTGAGTTARIVAELARQRIPLTNVIPR